MTVIKTTLPIFGAAIAVLISAGTATAQAPDPSQVYVQSIAYGGSGCPAGSVAQSFAADRQSFTLIFDQFIASQGTGVPVTNNRKNCQISLNLHLPVGIQVSVGTVDYRGYVQLPAGVTATQGAIYSFVGHPGQNNSSTSFTGPVAKDYVIRDQLQITSKVWSPCGTVAPLNINAQVRVSGGTSPAQITTDSVDGKVEQKVGLFYQSCE
jgi:hypothetical protein